MNAPASHQSLARFDVIPRSIRWRLPLTYAAIALLAALALGAVLLVTLRSYYSQQETDYLEARNLDPYEVMPLHGRGQKARAPQYEQAAQDYEPNPEHFPLLGVHGRTPDTRGAYSASGGLALGLGGSGSRGLGYRGCGL